MQLSKQANYLYELIYVDLGGRPCLLVRNILDGVHMKKLPVTSTVDKYVHRLMHVNIDLIHCSLGRDFNLCRLFVARIGP